MKTTVVVFENGAGKILINPSPESYQHLNHVVNPDLTPLRGIPPEMWVLRDGVILSDSQPKLPPIMYKNEDSLKKGLKDVEAYVKNSDVVLGGRCDALKEECGTISYRLNILDKNLKSLTRIGVGLVLVLVIIECIKLI